MEMKKGTNRKWRDPRRSTTISSAGNACQACLCRFKGALKMPMPGHLTHEPWTSLTNVLVYPWCPSPPSSPGRVSTPPSPPLSRTACMAVCPDSDMIAVDEPSSRNSSWQSDKGHRQGSRRGKVVRGRERGGA